MTTTNERLKWDRSGLKEACQRALQIGRTKQEFDIQLLLDMLLHIETLERASIIGSQAPTDNGRAWPTRDVLTKLADAADHLRDVHNCDCLGYEEVIAARDAAREIAALSQSAAHQDDPRAANDQSPSGQLWRRWFDRMGERATPDVINATATLVIEECELAAHKASQPEGETHG